MDLQISRKNLDLNDTTRDHITKKIGRLSRHLSGITAAKVEITRRNTRVQDQRVVAQITLDINGTVLRGEEQGSNAMTAVDSVIAVMARRVERYKGRVYKSEQPKKSGRNVSIRAAEGPATRNEDDALEEETVGATGKVVRAKRFPAKPMTLDEAAFQMELLGHDFFMFLDSETDQYSLLYKRHDGDYGLIQPEPL